MIISKMMISMMQTSSRALRHKSTLQRAVIFGLMSILFLGSFSSVSAKRWAVVFGTNYKGAAAGIPPLDLCERDAALFRDTLKRYGRYDEVKVFLGRRVNRKNVRNVLKYLSRRVRRNDTVVLYYAGHGTYTRDPKAPNGIRNTLVMFNRPHISDDDLNEMLKGIKTKKLVWVFDCCFSGGIVKKGRRGRGSGSIIENGKKAKVIANGSDQFYFQGKAIIGASDANETSIEIGGKINHGIFTYWFANGMKPKNGDLNRDRAVTALEAFEWSSRRVTGMAKRFNHRQHPQLSGNASGVILTGRVVPKPPRPDPKPAPVVKPPKPENKPKPSPVKPPVTPTKPEIPVTPEEPPVKAHKIKAVAHIFTTILQKRAAGVTSMNPFDIMRRSRRRGNTNRRIRVLVSGKDYRAEVRWLNSAQLRRKTGENIDLGRYTYKETRYPNKVAYIRIKGIPTGVHQIEIRADDYPVIRRRLGVERSSKMNKLFVVASLAGYGTIRGKVFLKNFDTPLKGQTIWMPTVNSPNTKFKMKSLSDGSFWFLNLPPGDNYIIKATFLENLPLDNRVLKVKSGGVTKVDVILNKRL